MAVTGYVLVTVEPPSTQRVVERLRAIPGAIVSEVTGPYDIIVELESDSTENLTSMVRQKIRPIPGVTSSLTCLVI